MILFRGIVLFHRGTFLLPLFCFEVKVEENREKIEEEIAGEWRQPDENREIGRDGRRSTGAGQVTVDFGGRGREDNQLVDPRDLRVVRVEKFAPPHEPVDVSVEHRQAAL